MDIALKRRFIPLSPSDCCFKRCLQAPAAAAAPNGNGLAEGIMNKALSLTKGALESAPAAGEVRSAPLGARQ